MRIDIRPATPDDAAAISLVHRSNVTRWVRWGPAGQARPARYADLTAYERWQHGGAWLDPDTCRYHLQRLVSGGGLPLVAEVNGRVVGTAEAHLADEPPPYGRNLNLSTLYVHRHHHGQGIGSGLLQYAVGVARRADCAKLIVANAEAPEFYRRHGLERAERWQRFRVPTTGARATHIAQPLPDSGYDLVRGQALVVGRYQNAHHDWERTRPGAAPDFAEWRGLKLERHWLANRRSRAALILEESPGFPGVANTFLFSLSPAIGPGLFSAVRGQAYALGFTHLHCLVRSDVRLPEAEGADLVHDLYWLVLA